MAESVSGWRWWVQYVIVPIVAGGGLVAAFIPPHRSDPSPGARATLNVAVEPDTVGIEPGGFTAVTYRFTELAGAAATVEAQDIRWLLVDGTKLSAEKGNRILGGSFTIGANGEHALLDNVYLPPAVASAARKRGQEQVQLETTFVASDASGQAARAKAVLRIGLIAKH